MKIADFYKYVIYYLPKEAIDFGKLAREPVKTFANNVQANLK